MKGFKLLIAIVLFASCEKQIHLDQFNYDKKLVLNGFNEVGEGIKINISESVDVLTNPDFNGLSGAMVVTVYQNGSIMQSDSIYVVDGEYSTFPPTIMGEEYSVKVELDGYPTIVANDRIPVYSPELMIDTAIRTGNSVAFTFNINDKPHSEYYMLTAFVVGLQVIDGDSSEAIYPVEFTSTDRIFATNISTIANQNDFALFQDELFNGTSRPITISISESQFYRPNFEKDRVRLIVKSVSKTTYNYYLGLLENNHVYGGPLATTVNDNGNVANGLGLLGFYTQGAAIYTIP